MHIKQKPGSQEVLTMQCVDTKCKKYDWSGREICSFSSHFLLLIYLCHLRVGQKHSFLQCLLKMTDTRHLSAETHAKYTIFALLLYLSYM